MPALPEGRVEIRVLGPLEVRRNGVPLPLGGPKQRAVLAYLVLNLGEVVTSSALGAAIWEEDPQVGVAAVVQTYVSQLRRLLEPDRRAPQPYRVLRTVPAGYLLDREAVDLDRVAFERTTTAARAALEDGRPADALREAEQALALWRDRPLPDLDAFGFVRGTAQQLDAARQDAVEIRLEAHLELGHHAAVVGELERRAADHPERERTTGQLMIALYRCGRQSDALAAYRRTRTLLVDHYGVEPAPPLQEIHRRVLQHDTGLAAADAPADSEPAAGPRPRRLRRSLVSLALVGILAAAGLVVWRQLTGDGPVNDYELLMRPGIAYDLDIPRGEPPDWHATNDTRSADFRHADVYRPVQGPDQIGGVDITGTNDYNLVQLVDRSDDPSTCRRLPTGGGGRVRLAGLDPGARICVRTRDGHWAQLTLLELPTEREAPVSLRIVVIPG